MRQTAVSAWHRLHAFLVAMAFVGYPLVSLVPSLTGLDSRIVSLPYRVVILLLSGICVALAPKGSSGIRFGVPMLLFVLCWVVLGLRYVSDVVVAGVQPSVSLQGGDFLAFVVGVSLLPTLPLFFRGHPRLLRRVQRGIALVCAVVIVLYAAFLGGRSAGELVRLQTEALNAITYGSLGAILILHALTYRFEWGHAMTAAIIRLTTVAVGGWAVVMSGSRGPILALVLALLPLLLVAWQRRHVSRIWLLAGIATTAVVASYLAPSLEDLSAGSVLAQRISNLEEDQSNLERLYLIQASWNIFAASPWTGGAIAEPVTHSYPHNIMLEALMVGGIGMGLVVAAIVLIALRSAWVIVRRDAGGSFLGGLIMFQVFMSMISGSLYTGPEFWAAYAIAVAYRAPPDRARVYLRVSSRPVG